METHKAYAFNFDLPTLAVFTGASAPLTRTLSSKFVERVNAPGSVIISAHTTKTLESHAHYLKTKCYKPKKIIKQNDNVAFGTKAGSDFFVHCATLDFNTNTHAIAATIEQALESDNIQYKQAILFHNAGRITLSKKPEDFTADEIANYFKHNVTSSICLNNVFLDFILPVMQNSYALTRKSFASTNDAMAKDKRNLFIGITRCFVVNLSSPLATNPLPGLGLGCASKAAREMYFKVVALENPDVTVLNYSPGPVKFETWQTLVDSTLNEKIKRADILKPLSAKKNEDSSSESAFVTIDNNLTVQTLLHILGKGGYLSGSHLDYTTVL